MSAPSVSTMALGLTAPAALPRAHGAALAHVRLRSTAADFEVDEILDFVPEGEGPHALVRVRKTDCNTDWVAARLAEVAGIARRDVGYAGMKDRRASATQWFSVDLQGTAAPNSLPDWGTYLPPEVEVLECVRHRRKLRRGQLAGNRFRLRLRAAQPLDIEQLRQRAAHITRRGVPNYYGPQRFGHRAANVQHAVAMFRDGRRPRSRHLRGIYLSAARSALFNEVLARRVSTGDWERVLPGEAVRARDVARPFAHTGCRESREEQLERALAEQRLHPTGPLWGEGESVARGHCRALELRVLAPFEVLTRGLENARIETDRRPLRNTVGELQVEPTSDGATLIFTLARGTYATSVVREMVSWSEPGLDWESELG